MLARKRLLLAALPSDSLTYIKTGFRLRLMNARFTSTHLLRTSVVDIAVANMPTDRRESTVSILGTLVTMEFQTVS